MRRQKNFQGKGGATKKTRPSNSSIKPLFALSISCTKIWWGHAPMLPAADAHVYVRFKERRPARALLFLSVQCHRVLVVGFEANILRNGICSAVRFRILP